MTSRDRITLVGVIILVLAIASVAGAWWWLSVGRHPLRGDLSHDFGAVPIGVGESAFHHRFELVNATSAPIVIQDIVEGCGCTEAVPSSTQLQPGDPVTIEVTLTLTHAGEKNTYIDVLIADHGPQRLWLRAVGMRALSIDRTMLEVRLDRARAVPYRLFADVQGSDSEPPQPKIAAPDALLVRFVDWELVNAADPDRNTAARWAGRFEVEANRAGGDQPDPAPPKEAFFYVTVGDQDPVRVRVLPWRDDEAPDVDEITEARPRNDG